MNASAERFTILCLGDIVARTGRRALTLELKKLIADKGAQLVVANGENAAGGTGLDPKCAEEIYSAGVDLITLGDHTWRRKELRPYLDRNSHRLVRPANYSILPEKPEQHHDRLLTVVPQASAGKGYLLHSVDQPELKIGLMNLMGRTFMNANLDCPFRKADELLAGPLSEADLVLCDFHAEATSEKLAMHHYLNGRVSALWGTHTHVPTADTRVSESGMAYVSDLGMCGSQAGVIGMDSHTAMRRFISGLPENYRAAEGKAEIQGVAISFDPSSGAALEIERIDRKVDLK